MPEFSHAPPSTVPPSTVPASTVPASTVPPSTVPPSTTTASPAAVFDRLVHGVGEGRWDELPGLYASRTNVVHPMDPHHAPPMLTRDALRVHFQGGAAVLGDLKMTPANITVHQTSDPEVIVAEFEYRGVVPATGEPFAIPNVFVTRVRDGQIVESRDYVDHNGLARVLPSPGQVPAD